MTEKLKNKKIIIYGDERYSRDFLYLFEDIKPLHLVDDKVTIWAKSWEILKKEYNDEQFVIICKYDERTAYKNLESLGLRKGIHFASAASFFKMLDFPIKDISQKRNVYIWGTGNMSHHFFHNFVEKNPDIEIVGCVDSDSTKSGKTYFRRPIYSPEEALEDERAFFIIASTLYYAEIKNHLCERGKKEKEDFIHYYAINTWASWMARETIYSVPRLNYVCPKAFSDAVVQPEGRLSVCAGIPGIGVWNTPIYYADFQDVWHSNVMKVLRLSILNGTYSFCNTEKCNLLSECNQQEIDINEMHYFTNRSKEQLEFISRKGTFSKNTVFNRANYEEKEKDYPTVILLSYDKTCNLHCPSCRENVYAAKGSEKEQLYAFTDKLGKQIFPFVDRIKVAGSGEAFASEIYKNILFGSGTAHIKKVGILSNGILFDKENFEKLEERYDEIHVFISMDGAVKKTAEKLRRGLNFEKWLSNMENLREMRESNRLHFLAFNFVVQRDNYKEMADFAKMCIGFHADQVKFSRVFNWGQYSSQEYDEISMFDSRGVMKPELKEIVEGDEIFGRSEIKLFQWVNW